MIYFGELHGKIRERNEQIRVLQAEVPRLLEVDERLRVIVAPEHKQRALEIAAEIKSLRAQNERDSAILAKAQEISERYNVPLDGLHQLSLSIPHLEKQVIEHELQIEKYKKDDSKQFEVEKDSRFSRIGQTCQKLRDARVSLQNHQAAKAEVEALLAEQSQKEAR